MRCFGHLENWYFLFFKQKTAYEITYGDWSSDVCSSDLGLIQGGWEVTDARDIYLNEVFNPNGSLNSNKRTSGARVKFQFDYALDAFAHFTARNSVQLLGTSPARLGDNSDRLPIYPPQLEIH